MNELLAQQLTSDLSVDARAFLPELVLCASIVLLLLIRLIPRYDRLHMGWIALFLSGLALLVTCLQWPGFHWSNLEWTEAANYIKKLDPRFDVAVAPPAISMFGGMLIFDNFTIFIKLFLLAFIVMVIILTLMTKVPDREDSADFYCLLLGATIGMSIMASSNHLLMVFIGIEMASVPSYAMAGFLKGRRPSSEAALKYVVYGGGAAGVMLYGMSLLAGTYGTGYLPDVVRFVTAGELHSTVIL